jgi:hypothetical protein
MLLSLPVDPLLAGAAVAVAGIVPLLAGAVVVVVGAAVVVVAGLAKPGPYVTFIGATVGVSSFKGLRVIS